jgi:gliding motility-associated transport system permease protein
VRSMLIIYRREIGALFATPLAWVLLFVSLLVNGYLFSQALSYGPSVGAPADITAAIETVFGGNLLFWALMLVLSPLLAMRLLAEEAAGGTLEYLRTAPVSDAAVVLGKFGAGMTFMALLWGSIFIYAGGISYWGGPPDWGQVFAIYIGSVLASGVFVAISLIPSAFSSTPILAAFLSFMACLGWLLMPWAGAQALVSMRGLLSDIFGGYAKAEAFILTLFSRMSVFDHFGRSYYRGVLDSAEVVFFLTWIGFFLFLTTRTLEARRWRG